MSVRSVRSVVQDEALAKWMHKTPGSPIKNYLHTPRKSDRKKSLFPTASPSNSDDMGLSPIGSTVSNYSVQSLPSPQFSPNGKFSTPSRTPLAAVHAATRHNKARRKLDVKSSLYDALKASHSPRTPRSSQVSQEMNVTPSTRQMMAALQDIVDREEILKDLTTPTKSVKKTPVTVRVVQSTPPSTSSERSHHEKVDDSPKMSKFGVKSLTADSFYGPVPKAPPKPKSTLLIDTLDLKNNERKRSLSRDSSASRSFVSASGNHNRTNSGGTKSQHRPRSTSRRGPHVGVWHGIKKPKKLKKPIRIPKPLLSPKSRLAKMLKPTTPSRKVQTNKRVSLFEEKPKLRKASMKKKRNIDEVEDNGIIDTFPYGRKRQKLPSGNWTKNKVTEVQQVEVNPDPNKKFMKHGNSKRVTCTIFDNIKVQINDGNMRLETPKKRKLPSRRKFYSPSQNFEADFNDVDEELGAIGASVKNILQTLNNDKVDAAKKQLLTPCKVQVDKISDSQLFDILNSPSTRVNVVMATPSKMITTVQNSPNNKLLTNMSTLAIADKKSPPVSEGISLGTTGSFISQVADVLNPEESYPMSSDGEEVMSDDSENQPPEEERLYSLFYKDNWMKALDEPSSGKNSLKKKRGILVPDDQYLLDAGQKSIGIVTCSKCGVMYQAGDYADEATHNKFHYHLPELKFTGWNNERVVATFEDDGRVILIRIGDPKTWWHKAFKILEIVDEELGFPEMSLKSLRNKYVYLFISGKAKQVIGCLVAEHCSVAYKMFPPLEGVELDSCSDEPSSCEVGVSRIWTALSHRRHGVATRLVETMRKSFIAGHTIPADLVAFTSPSPSGKILAQKVTGRLDFLVYGFK